MKDHFRVTLLYQFLEEDLFGLAVDNQHNLYYTVYPGLWRYSWREKIPPQLIVEQEGADMNTIVWDGKNNVIICVWNDHCVSQYAIDTRKISVLVGTTEKGHQDGTFETATFHHPWGITIDKYQDLYVTDWHHIRKINMANRTVETVAGSTRGKKKGGYLDGLAVSSVFDKPQGLAVCSDGTILVCDRGNKCIRTIKDGIVSTLAGIPKGAEGRKKGMIDGTLAQSQFSRPWDILLLEDGSFLVADTELRKVDISNNRVTTFRGIKDPICLARNHEDIYVGTATSILLLQNTWKYERFLWIARLKEDGRYCLLARLPSEVIQEIASNLVLTSHK